MPAPAPKRKGAKKKAPPAKVEKPEVEAAVAKPKERPVEMVAIDSLKPHPKNYKAHPERQLKHIAESLKEHSYYRNIIVARDNTILAGHGVALAAKSLGWEKIPVMRVDVASDDPLAMKILVSDNELGRFAESDDRALTEILKQINADLSLFGTGYDQEDLAALLMVTRPESEIQDFDAAAEWVGMPEYETGVSDQFILTVQCTSVEDREEAAAKLDLKNLRNMKQGKIWTGWYPDREKSDLSSLEWKENARSTRTGKKLNGEKTNGKAAHK